MPGFANGTPLGTVRQLLNDTGLRKNNFAASRAPLSSDDAAQGYEVGSRWLYSGQEWVYTGSAWVAVGGSTAWADVTGKPTTFAPTAHRHDASEIDNLPTGGGSTAWDDITGKPTAFPTTWTTVTGKPTTFAPSAHTHAWADITNPPATYAPTAHNHPISNVIGLQAALDDKLPAREQRKVLTAHATVTGTTFASTGLSFTIEAGAAYHVFLLGRVSSDTATSGGAVMLVGPSDCTENGMAWIPNTNGANGNFNQQRFDLGAGPPTPSTGVGTINVSYPIMGHWLVLAGATAGTVQVQIQAEEAAATFRLYANSWLIARRLEAT